MKVSKLLSNLSYGKLSNLSMSESGGGTIVTEKIPQIILAANEGLLRLYSRFVLKEDAVFIEMIENVTQYHLSSEYALSKKDTYPTNYHYIVDYGDPFKDDAIRITSVYNECGQQYPLNDENVCGSLFTPQPLVLQFPAPRGGQAISVGYQASHTLLTVTDLDVQIELPPTLQGALTSFIASEIYSNMGGQENTAKSQEHMLNFESVCADVEAKDVISNTISATNTRFHQNGWI